MNRKILMIASQEIIDDLSDGGKKGSYRNFLMLQDIFGKENVYLIMCTKYKGSFRDNIYRMNNNLSMIETCFNMVQGSVFTDKDIENEILDVVAEKNIEMIFLDRSLYGRLAKSIKKKMPEILIWTFCHNVEVNYFYNKFKNNIILAYIIRKLIKKIEKDTLNYSDCIFALTERDCELLKLIYKYEVKYIIPTTFIDNYNKERECCYQGNTKELLFIGSMFGPNYHGIKWFVENVMIELKEYTLSIVGKNFQFKKNELERENVKVIGSVESLEDFYYKNNIMVMPIFYGDGQKVKTAEAMMYGKTILATDEALEGYLINGIEGIFRCNNKEEFVECLRKIEKMNNSRERSESVRRLFLDKYSYESMVEKYRNILLDEINKKLA